MRLAVLAHSLRFGGGRAVGRGVLGALSRVDPALTILAVVPDGVGYEELVAGAPGVETIVYRRFLGGLGRFAYDELVLTPRVRAFRPDAILALNGRGLTRPPAPQALFPQSAYLFYPRRHYGDMPEWMVKREGMKRRDLRKQLARCALLVVQTPVVAARIREALGYRGPVLICGAAVGEEVAGGPAGTAPPAMQRAKAAGGIVLFYPATYSTHKNPEVLLDAFERPGGTPEGVTVITTFERSQHPVAGRFLDRLARSPAREAIVNVGAIPSGGLAAHYAHCDALVMPSLIETVGLPYLEAMHFGKPILTSDLDFAHEVCGDAAGYFDPFDPASVREAIVRFRDDPAWREALAAASRERARRWTGAWEDVARSILTGVSGIAGRS